VDIVSSAAAAEAASLAAARRKTGRSVDMRNTQIAGIALVRHAAWRPGLTNQLEMMKRDFGKAVDAHGNDRRSGTDRRISDHIVIHT
jgi:hypothetical protein